MNPRIMFSIVFNHADVQRYKNVLFLQIQLHIFMNKKIFVSMPYQITLTSGVLSCQNQMNACPVIGTAGISTLVFVSVSICFFVVFFFCPIHLCFIFRTPLCVWNHHDSDGEGEWMFSFNFSGWSDSDKITLCLLLLLLWFCLLRSEICSSDFKNIFAFIQKRPELEPIEIL